MEKSSASQAAELLGISLANLEILKKQGLVHAILNTEGVSFYSLEEIEQIKSRRGLTLSQEAAQINSKIQRDLASSVTFTKKVLTLAGIALAGYVSLIAVFIALFIINPLQTARWLGIAKNKGTVLSTKKKSGNASIMYTNKFKSK